MYIKEIEVWLHYAALARPALKGTASAVPRGMNKNKTRGPSGPRDSKGVNELQFQIKDQDYFLAFVEQEKCWYVIAPTPQGVHRIPVYVDVAKYGAPAVLGSETSLSS
jgi:hypothetical protein